MFYRNWKEAREWAESSDQPLARNQNGGSKNNSVAILRERHQFDPIIAEPIASLAIIIHAFHLD